MCALIGLIYLNSSCQHDFPGLVHFVLIVRSRGRIYTPVLFTDEYKTYLSNRNIYDPDHVKEKKVSIKIFQFSFIFSLIS